MDVIVGADVSGSVSTNSKNFVNMRAFTTALFVNLRLHKLLVKVSIVEFAVTAEVTLQLTDNKVKALVSVVGICI